MQMKFNQLSKPERQFIQQQWLKGKPKREIARMLGRSHSTICYAINNKKNLDYFRKLSGKVVKTYVAKKAQQHYEQNKLRCGAKYKFTKDESWLEYIEKGVLAGDSPKVVIGRSKLENVTFKVVINPRTFYNYVEHGISKVTAFDLRFKLRRKIPKHRVIRENKRKMGKSIELRPNNINARTEFGHWEGDCIVDKHDNAILVCLERLSRFCVLRKLVKHESKEVLETIRALKKEYCMKSITVDNGSEFYKITQLEDEGFEVYFTHPYSSFEKGSIENLNGMIRRYIPKGTDLYKLSEAMIERAQNQVNSYPRGIHGYYTAEEIYISLTNNEPPCILKRETDNVIFFKTKWSN